MAEPQKPQLSRREFFEKAARNVSLTALGALGATLIGRGLGRRPDETCVNRGRCRQCSLLDDCHLPQGRSAREVLRT